jgi:uncharacterized protein (UPF0212 family)
MSLERESWTTMDCRVVVEAAVPVYDVATADEAVRIAISKTGEMLNPDLNYVEIDMGERSCPHCDEALEPAFIAADEGLVALELEMTVFNVEREEHASRIARKEIGQRLENIPLEVLVSEVIDEDDGDAGSDEEGEDDEPDEAVDPDGESATDDVLPEFEDLIDEN